MPICNPANQPPWRPNKHWQWGNIYFNWCLKHCFFSKECHVFSLDVNTAGNSRRVEEFVAALSSLDIPFKQQGLVITTKRIDTCPVSTLLRFLMKGCKFYTPGGVYLIPWGSKLFTWKSPQGHLQASSWGQDSGWYPWPGRQGCRMRAQAACLPASTSVF